MTTDITELAQRARINAECGEHLSPAETMDLVEALESEKRICATWRKTAKSTGEKLEKAQSKIIELQQGYEIDPRTHEIIDLQERIADLESRTVKLPPCVDDLHGIGMVMSADAVIEALTSYGIKVEAE
ncbi:TPA: hypothetical protein L9N02_005057 [Klebsiella quasipneumoniae subsp. similipneumoniae]|nr:hypothetical protein [Klebsiella quasipneumoniae subsp. similipneumoniae]HDE1061257.1 hypothetical protein [Klebsiella quasipneumoniae]